MIGPRALLTGPEAAQALRSAWVVLPVLAVGLSALRGSFQFDDFNVIVGNPVANDLGAWWQEFPRGNRPLLKLSYVLSSAAGGTGGFHALNLAVHLLNVLLVQALALRLLARDGTPAPHAAAAVAALLFGLHPAHTESVTYISGRSSSLMALFYLGSVLAYVTGRERARPLLHALLSPLLFVLALATKESAVSLPLVLLAWELATPGAPQRPRLRPLWPHAGVLLALAAAVPWHPVYATRLIPDLAPQALAGNLASQVDALAWLLATLAWPWPLNIDPDLRPFNAVSAAWAARAALLLVLLGLAVQSLRGRLGSPWQMPGWGMAWFFAVLAPTNSLLPRLDLANERQLYLAGVGPIIAVGSLWAHLHARRPRLARGLALALLLGCAALTVRRNADYVSELTLWTQTVRVSPAKARAHSNLGYAYSAAGCPAQAEAAYRQALRLDPAFSRAAENLQALHARGLQAPHARGRASPAAPHACSVRAPASALR